jgi:hypothetical protein
MRVQHLAKRWQELSFSEKLGISLTLIGTVAALVYFVFPYIFGPPRVAEQLEVVQMSVVDSVRATDVEAAKAPAIDIKLRNVGGTVAVVTQADLTVLDDGRIRECEPGTGGPLNASVNYGLSVPVDPDANTTHRAPMSLQIAANEADRVTISIDAPDLNLQQHAAVLYAFDVALRQGPRDESVSIGRAVIAFPEVPGASAFTGSFAGGPPLSGALSCLEENDATLLRFLEFDGAKPPGLTKELLKPVAPTPRPTAPPTPAGTPQTDLVVVDSGFSYYADDPFTITGAVIVENLVPRGKIARSVVADLTMYDGDGAFVESLPVDIGEILPGQRMAGTLSTLAPGVKSVDVWLSAEWEEIDYEVGSFTAEQIQLTSNESSTTVTGLLDCDFKRAQENVEVVVVLRSEDGRIVDGEVDSIEEVPCGQGVRFSISTEHSTNATVAEVYANTLP